MSPRPTPAVPAATVATIVAAVVVASAVAFSAPLAAATPTAPRNAPAPATRPAATPPATKPPTAGRAATGAPAAAGPASAKPAASGPATSKPAASRPAPSKPAASGTVASRPTAPGPAAPRPAARPAPKKASAKAPAPPPPEGLKPGQFRWLPELSPDGPVVLVVSLPDQLVHVYRNGIRIGVSTISSGMPGYETITGVFPILERQTEHYSNLYDNAPMPYMLRLTWSGTALHAGHLPGRPASHGCVRLPKTFAASLFDTVRRGTVVVIADAASHPAQVVRPGWLSPVDPATGAPVEAVESANAERWSPERAPEGPLGLMLSTADGVLVVLRNGVEIGRAPATVSGTPAPGTRLHALRVIGAATTPEVPAPADAGADTAATAPATAPAPAATRDADTADAQDVAAASPGAPPDLSAPLIAPPALGPPPPAPELHWQALAMPGQTSAPGTLPLRGGALRLSEAFARQLHTALPAEARLVITDEPLRPPAPAASPTPSRGDATPVTPATPTPAQMPNPAG